ncbi:MAG: HD domain-containing protein [Deltaproteobacteria bacterium]|nr:HD domain-containing protein [Deltaproteobacteria bacterium]
MKCPGQDSRYWKPGAIFEVKCPKCGEEVEFFKDEATRRCKQCGHPFLNPAMDFGCASYCQYAEQCIGELPPELIAQKEDLLKDRVAVEMKRYFKNDFKRIGHASRVARYAERIGRQEGANLAVVLPAAYLHDIGIREAERKHQSSAARYQEEEGPPVAREILSKLGAREELISEVCDIIGHHHHPRQEESVNFRCVYDADCLVNLEEDHRKNPIAEEKLESLPERVFLTESGRKLAREVLLPQTAGAHVP